MMKANNKTITGGLSNVGAKLNKVGRPTIYIEKHFPIEGRKDFFKWIIVTPNGWASDYKGETMFFDDVDQAKLVCKARRKVARLNKSFLK